MPFRRWPPDRHRGDTKIMTNPRSLVSLQFALSPMLILARRIEHALDVPIQGPHDTDACKPCRPAERRDQDQGFHRGLPLCGLVLGLRELGDVGAGILQRDEWATAREW